MPRTSTLPPNWAMVPVTVVLVLMLGRALLDWRQGPPETGTSGARPVAPETHPGAGQVRQFFAWHRDVAWRPFTNVGNPFFTLAIQPPPPPKPPPAPPATKKVDLTYRGYFETSAAVRRAVIQVADRQVIAGRGQSVVADFVASEIEARYLALTNAAGQAVQLDFGKPKAIEIPAK